MSRFVNFVMYQIGWFACVLGAAWGHQWLGVGFACLLLISHWVLAADRQTQLKLSLAAAAVGLLVDSFQLRMGVFDFPQGTVMEGLPPPFMIVLWMQFATTFRYCLGWLSGRYAWSFGFGLCGAPLAFFAGEKLGAITFLEPRALHFLVLGLLWSVTVPLLMALADRWGVTANDAEYRWALGPR